MNKDIVFFFVDNFELTLLMPFADVYLGQSVQEWTK